MPNPHDTALEILQQRESEMVSGLQAFLRTPGFSNTGEGIVQSAEYCAQLLQELGAQEVELVDTGGHPAVSGYLASDDPDAKTLLCYSLYDMVPVEGDTWRSDPVGAEIVPPTQIGLPAELGEVICSRGTHNQRGPMFAALEGIKAMTQAGGSPVNILFCWEGEEELASPNLHKYVAAKGSQLEQCDALWIPAMTESQSGWINVGNGFLGAYLFELHCKAGSWGGAPGFDYIGPPHVGWVDAPLIRLVEAISTFFDHDQNVTIDGLVGQIPPLSEQDEALVEELIGAMDESFEAEWRQILGVENFRNGQSMASSFHRTFDGILANIEGIDSGYIGPEYRATMPQVAKAKFDMEFPPGLDPGNIEEAIRGHLDKRGFNEMTIENARGYAGYRTDPNADNSLARANAFAAQAYGRRVVESPWVGWACPAGVFRKFGLDVPTVYGGAGHGERPHQPDEYITKASVLEMAKYTVTFLHSWANGGTL